VSFILRPDCPPAAAPQLGFVGALGLSDAVAAIAPPGAELRCKWPNDVLLNGKKLAGILLESETRAREDLDWLVVGIGVNVVGHPEAADYPTTSLHAEGCAAVDSGMMIEILASRRSAPPGSTARSASAMRSPSGSTAKGSRDDSSVSMPTVRSRSRPPPVLAASPPATSFPRRAEGRHHAACHQCQQHQHRVRDL
jgi:BirA family biotin operon repressor/biotin-[acetyl-CoA-carboxylase] ligase